MQKRGRRRFVARHRLSQLTKLGLQRATLYICLCRTVRCGLELALGLYRSFTQSLVFRAEGQNLVQQVRLLFLAILLVFRRRLRKLRKPASQSLSDSQPHKPVLGAIVSSGWLAGFVVVLLPPACPPVRFFDLQA